MKRFSSSAKIIDGTLILTLPDAITPVVWQMQLGQTKSSALEVRDQNDGSWLLVLKTPRMDVMQIAPFASKDRAVKALLAVSRAMEKAQGQLGNYAGNPAYPVPAVIPNYSGRSFCGFLCRLFKWFLYLALAFVALIILINAFLLLTRPTVPATGPGTAASAPAGAPVSAEDFLNNQ